MPFTRFPAHKIDIKKRSCLTCGKMFTSQSAVNRRCKKCKYNAKKMGDLPDKLTVHKYNELG